MDIENLTGTGGETLNGLSVKTGIARTTLRRKLANPGLFTLSELGTIASALGQSPAHLAYRVLGSA